MADKAFDVIVIGGGPAGSVCAAALADHGHSVAVLERQEFPRFHIGESMLPYMIGLLERLDLLDAVGKQGYVVKRGGEFIDPTGTKFVTPGVYRADFSKQGEGRHSETFQVERAHFDQVLLEKARANGAEVITGASVRDLVMTGDRITGVRYRHEGGEHEISASFVVDASGRAGTIANRFGLRKTTDGLRMVAVFRHYEGLDERHNPGHEGDIQIGSHADGWVWAIPLSGDKVSVGTVMPRAVFREAVKEDVFAEHVARIPRIVQRLSGTRPSTEFRVEADYCYHADEVTGPGWLMAGDAGCFGDPMFSGGTLVAMVTAARAADTITRVLADPGAERALTDEYANFFKTGYDTYVRLIFAFYQSELISAVADASTVVERENLEMYMVRLLGGDFWSEHNPIAQALRANTAWRTFAPFRPVFGCPVYPELDAADRAEVAAARP
ncbi:NAD(P)/FAD-dependent oxidoreductase [Amycolatopsis alba]|uniref:NAD(P)/FAD-dependent oxidoreductase n=2 Tax=Amycolatopsis TaxID=1813 RepID=A0A229RIW9_AMYAL|nr:NAD(P)/FAD-dependent oxidoreductase [Amycolatopsis alba]OXM46602.1 NAD(P)/FAD-dependent oxidoreductase [Amycolatopsis alba DSM 44262]QGJ79663.1 Halogenase [Amycolatopsis sp. CP2808]